MSTTYPGPWEAVCDFLVHCGVEVVFALPADDLALLPAAEASGLRVVLCREQRTAVYAATAYALTSGRLGVCAVGKGPALTNALTGLLEASSSAAPVLLLAAGTAADRQGSGAFQELDQVALCRPLSRWAHSIGAPHRVVPCVERAALTALGGPPGPVYLEVPDALLGRPVERTRAWSPPVLAARPLPAPEDVARSAALLRSSRRPVVLAGGGLRQSLLRAPDGADEDATRGPAEGLAERLGAALAVTASGRGAVDESHELFCGVSGLYAPPGTEALWQSADLVIALGSRLEETSTTGWPGADRLPVVQVLLDPADAFHERTSTVLLGDAAATARAWLDVLGPAPQAPAGGWVREVRTARAAAHREAAAVVAAVPARDTPRVADVLAALRRACPDPVLLVQENGLSDMWSYWYPYWTADVGGSLVPSEQTSLGFGAAGALGAWFARPGRPVVALTGDGAFDTLGADLRTVASCGAGIVYVVLCNGGYGWLQAQWQRTGDGSPRFADPSAPLRPLPPDVEELTVRTRSALDPLLARALRSASCGHPVVVRVPVDLDDRPPGIDEVAGDLPATACVPAPRDQAGVR